MELKKLKVGEIKSKYTYAKDYLCYKILMKELKDLDDEYLFEAPVERIISEKKVKSVYKINYFDTKCFDCFYKKLD